MVDIYLEDPKRTKRKLNRSIIFFIIITIVYAITINNGNLWSLIVISSLWIATILNIQHTKNRLHNNTQYEEIRKWLEQKE